MKVFKKSLAVILAALMALGGMAVAASAVDTITVRFYADINGNNFYESSEITTKVVSTTGVIVAPAGIERTGYTLKGWTDNFTYGTDYTGAYYSVSEGLGTLAADTDFYAVFQANKYTVTFDANGGTVAVATKEVAYDSPITVEDIPAPTKTLSTFSQWSRSKDEYAPLGKMDNIAGVTLYALWTDTPAGAGTIYTFDTDGTLTITGYGTVEKQSAWVANYAAVKKIVIDGSGPITVGEKAFEGLAALEQVVVYSDVAFGDYAFNGCSNLAKINTAKKTGVNYSGAITGIGAYTFRDCVSFKGINSNGMDLTAYTADKIAAMEGAFYGCSSLKKVVFDTDVTTIPAKMFFGCSTLSSLNPSAAVNVSFPTSVTVIGDSAFEGCSALENMAFGKNISTIGNYAFADCTALKAINVYSAAMGKGAFSGCRALATFECTSFKEIPEECFKDCSSLTAFDFTKVSGSGVTKIGASAFEGCTLLSTVTFSGEKNAEILIDKYAFLGCTALASVTFPESCRAAVGEMALGYSAKAVKALFGTEKMTIVCSSNNNKTESGYTGIYDYAAGFNRVTHAQQGVDTVMPLLKKLASFFSGLLPVMGNLFTTLFDFIKKMVSSATGA